ncbi:MAG: flagellar motor protein [Betaproteobacteria bacterium]|nr:flagellar motor protein [Betaproteobacteria bacterium]
MDVLSIIGLTLALGAILFGQWVEGGSMASLVQLAAFFIVIGGTLGAVMLQTPVATFWRGLRLARWIFSPPAVDYQAAIAQLAGWADTSRRDGMLALENQLDAIADPFTRNGLQMLVDGYEPERIREAMHIDINYYENRQKTAARVWESAGGYAPTIGILGAVMGLIHVMENLTEPLKLGAGIAVAFVATIYGVGSANLIFLPIAGKLKALVDAQVVYRELVLDGLLGIANGENPKLIEARLQGFLPAESDR